MCNSCLIHFICNAKDASLFEMELEEFTYESDKITASSQANMLSKQISNHIECFRLTSVQRLQWQRLQEPNKRKMKDLANLVRKVSYGPKKSPISERE